MTPTRVAVLMSLHGSECAACTRPARCVDITRQVHHVDTSVRPCLLPAPVRAKENRRA